jgi:hypothetical protein
MSQPGRPPQILALVRHPSFLAVLAVLTGAFLRFHRLGQVPPGLHYDFAANAILAGDIAAGNFRDVFITAYTGKEVLFFYTAGLLFKLIGSSIFTLQLTAALYGVLGIAACYFAVRELTRDDPESPWVAALAAAILSFTFMHLVWSRYGERATTEPFVQGLAVGFVFRGLRDQTRAALLSWALAGLFTGLAAYTYLAARLFPIPIAITLAAALLQAARRSAPAWPTRLSGALAVFFIGAALVFAPLGVFFLQHPETFFNRASQLIPRPGETGLLVQGILGALGMIFVAGEPYDRFNLPGRPIFGPVLGFFFVAGLLIVAARCLRARSSLARLSNLFVLVYSLVFLIPTALSVHDIFPSHVRSMGLLPVLAVFPALGIVTISHWVLRLGRPYRGVHASQISENAQSQASGAKLLIANCQLLITLFTLVCGSAATYYSYFHLWAAAPSLHYANDTDLVNASRWINGQDLTETSVYFSAIHYRHPTVAYLARDFAAFRWFTGGASLALPEGPALYVFPHAAPPPEDWIANWTPVAAPPGPDGTPDFRAYRFSAPPPMPEFIPASANFGNLIEITGFRVPGPGWVDVRLRVLNPPDRPDYRLVADLADPAGHRWTQAFNDSYFSEQWQVGETILMRLNFDLAIGTPPGEYQLLTTIYAASANTNLPALTPEGYAAAYAAIGPVPVPSGSPQPLRQPLVVLNGLNLVQLDPPPARIRPGEKLPFTLYWQAHAPTTNDPALVTKLDSMVVESGPPLGGRHPASHWQPGEIVIDRHDPRLPRDLAPGVYPVTVDDFVIGTVTVEVMNRRMAPPSPVTPFLARFEDQFELVGYDLAPDSLTLYWRALAETGVDYTAFVHVLDANGRIIAQHDSPPHRGEYATSLWVSGEYVSDTISLPTEGSAIEIGWYVAETGERLKTGGGDAVRILP